MSARLTFTRRQRAQTTCSSPTCRFAWPLTPKPKEAVFQGDKGPVLFPVPRLVLRPSPCWTDVSAGAATAFTDATSQFWALACHAQTVSGNRWSIRSDADQMLPFVGNLVTSLFVYLSSDSRSAPPVCRGPANLNHGATAHPRILAFLV
jgi:hypothetical protein